jgi:hypothetical protein
MYFRDCKTLSVFERKIPLTLELVPPIIKNFETPECDLLSKYA